MKFIKYIGLFLFFLPLNAYLQNPGAELLRILKTYEPLKYIDYGFTYTSLDANNDTFYLENKGELLFSSFRCNAIIA